MDMYSILCTYNCVHTHTSNINLNYFILAKIYSLNYKLLTYQTIFKNANNAVCALHLFYKIFLITSLYQPIITIH